MKNNFIKVHETASRIRYKYFLLKEKFIDENILQTYLEKVEGVLSVRINKKAFSIIFEVEENITDKLENILRTLTLDELLENCDSQAVCVSCVSSEEPSLSGTIRASSALISERFITNDLLKAGVTTAACLPLLVDGSKELLKEG